MMINLLQKYDDILRHPWYSLTICHNLYRVCIKIGQIITKFFWNSCSLFLRKRHPRAGGFLNFPAMFSAEFLHLQDIILCLIFIPWIYNSILEFIIMHFSDGSVRLPKLDILPLVPHNFDIEGNLSFVQTIFQYNWCDIHDHILIFSQLHNHEFLLMM